MAFAKERLEIDICVSLTEDVDDERVDYALSLALRTAQRILTENLPIKRQVSGTLVGAPLGQRHFRQKYSRRRNSIRPAIEGGPVQ